MATTGAGDSPSDQPLDALSEAEAAFFDAHSGTRANPEAMRKARAQAASERKTDRAESLDVHMVAKLLTISPQGVRRRLGERTIYAYSPDSDNHARLIPRWQFIENKEIPQLGEVLRALPDELSHLYVRAFVQNARIDHPIEARTVANLEWLLAGADPNPAVALAREQDQTV